MCGVPYENDDLDEVDTGLDVNDTFEMDDELKKMTEESNEEEANEEVLSQASQASQAPSQASQAPTTSELSSENQAMLVSCAANSLLGIRENVRVNQAKQAKRMLTRSKKVLCPVNIGDYVILPIPEVDRSVSSSPNIICRVVDYDNETDLFELACAAGALNIKFARNCFEKLESDDVAVTIKTDKKVSVREAASEIDIGGGQGMLKCNCCGECANNRCSCKKAALKCNSRCHHGNSKCKNK